MSSSFLRFINMATWKSRNYFRLTRESWKWNGYTGVSANDGAREEPLSGCRPARVDVPAVVNTNTDAASSKKIVPKDAATRAALEKNMGKNVLFSQLAQTEQNDIFNAMSPVEKHDSEVIIQQGENGDNFYVIESGKCEVIVDGVHVSTIVEGGSFRELVLINGSPRAATVKLSFEAKGEVKVWAIDRKIYHRIFTDSTIKMRKTKVPKDAATLAALEKNMGKNVLFSHLPESEKKDIFDAISVENHDSDVIIQQGEDGDNFYVIESGECEVFVDEVQVAKLVEGQSFGQLALIHDNPRNATVTAKGEVKLWAIDRKTFYRSFMGSSIQKRDTESGVLRRRESIVPIEEQESQHLIHQVDTNWREDLPRKLNILRRVNLLDSLLNLTTNDHINNDSYEDILSKANTSAKIKALSDTLALVSEKGYKSFLSHLWRTKKDDIAKELEPGFIPKDEDAKFTSDPTNHRSRIIGDDSKSSSRFGHLSWRYISFVTILAVLLLLFLAIVPLKSQLMVSAVAILLYLIRLCIYEKSVNRELEYELPI